MSPLLKGIKVSLVHGYLLVGPFALNDLLGNMPMHDDASAVGTTVSSHHR
jgi:photosystem I subunit 11